MGPTKLQSIKLAYIYFGIVLYHWPQKYARLSLLICNTHRLINFKIFNI